MDPVTSRLQPQIDSIIQELCSIIEVLSHEIVKTGDPTAIAKSMMRIQKAMQRVNEIRNTIS